METKPSRSEMASIVQSDGIKSSDTRVRLLVLADILRMFTDESHGLTAKDLSTVIGIIAGKEPSENTVLDDLHSLMGGAHIGMTISGASRGKSSGFRCEKTFITSSQARLLINMTRTCKFITPSQRNEICSALHELVSYYQQDEIVESVYVDERERPVSQDVFAALDVFSSAIKREAKVRFQYCNTDLHGRDIPMLAHADGSGFYCETPVALIYSYGSYYLETLSSDEKLMYRRLDKVRNPAIDAPETRDQEMMAELRSGVGSRISQKVDMWGIGTPRTLFLRIREDKATYVRDRFGADIQFSNIVERDGIQYGFLCLEVQLSPTFYRWLFGMGDGVVITKPSSDLWTQGFWNEHPYARKERSELIADYEAALEGMKEQMATVANEYGWSVVPD